MRIKSESASANESPLKKQLIETSYCFIFSLLLQFLLIFVNVLNFNPFPSSSLIDPIEKFKQKTYVTDSTGWVVFGQVFRNWIAESRQLTLSCRPNNHEWFAGNEQANLYILHLPVWAEAMILPQWRTEGAPEWAWRGSISYGFPLHGMSVNFEQNSLTQSTNVDGLILPSRWRIFTESFPSPIVFPLKFHYFNFVASVLLLTFGVKVLVLFVCGSVRAARPLGDGQVASSSIRGDSDGRVDSK